MLLRTNFVFNYVTNFRRCIIVGRILFYFSLRMPLNFSVFFDKILLNSIGFVCILLCCRLNVCDREVTAVKN